MNLSQLIRHFIKTVIVVVMIWAVAIPGYGAMANEYMVCDLYAYNSCEHEYLSPGESIEVIDYPDEKSPCMEMYVPDTIGGMHVYEGADVIIQDLNSNLSKQLPV
ncbi:MAG: hypothetical protein F6J90_15340 [Moorea sp. SIOASIH]|uniref:hypothetical protein n=1 Tax=Moorena sp. SIOASIH TaxID=2607817 RepID=UPI0013BA6730|nr:hypothetical protein [Moorena sp. SIOASIH]NEO37628.1 hypothetical protein [Moorena sp. SIOASIH]